LLYVLSVIQRSFICIFILKFHAFSGGRSENRDIFIRVFPDSRKSPLKYIDLSHRPDSFRKKRETLVFISTRCFAPPDLVVSHTLYLSNSAIQKTLHPRHAVNDPLSFQLQPPQGEYEGVKKGWFVTPMRAW
jgi:hypothetical protein